MSTTPFVESPVTTGDFGTIGAMEYDAPAVLEAPRRVTPKGLASMPHKRITPIPPDPNPSGMCMCGCGRRTTVYTRNHPSAGRFTGHHARFVHGHNRVKYHGPLYVVEDRGYHTPCLIWRGNKDHKGYAMVNVNGTTAKQHRINYEAKYGPIPDGLQIDHLCRQRDCCNPDHLEPVTPAENSRRGLSTKLTVDDVRGIRKLLREGLGHTEIGRRFGVTAGAIYRIAKGTGWVGVGEDADDE